MFKNLKIDWKDFALGFFIGVTLCLYSYVSQKLDTNNTEPTSRITGIVTTEQVKINNLTKERGESLCFFPFFMQIGVANVDNVLYSGSIKEEQCI